MDLSLGILQTIYFVYFPTLCHVSHFYRILLW